MEEQQILQQVQQIVAKKTGLEEDKITPEADFREDLLISSVVIVSIVLAVEMAFEIQISDDEIVELSTISDAVGFIKSKLAG
jgi:acyl carrier protein